ncbi:MAG: hypothetical protein LBH73_09055 [Spirochaetaceae bacterium]|nr:hypothetical protein [Spirochaetaceae bacterium]
MKGVARLIIFFTLCFILTLVLSSLCIFAARLLNAASHIPALPLALIPVFLAALRGCIPAAIYITVLLGLGYAVRREVPAPLALVCLFLLTVSASGALYLGTVRAGRFDSLARIDRSRTLGAPGLILSQGDISMVLLEAPGEEKGPRVVSIPGQALLYQRLPVGPGNQALPLPSAAFKAPLPYFLQSILLDFTLADTRYGAFLEQGFHYFIAYLAAISLFLCSLGFLFKISVWPLANLFIGALVFRGILAFETFINSREVLELLGEYIESAIPRPLISALILSCAAGLILLYSLLVWLSKRRRSLDG